MGLRFRKSMSILPGVRMNFGLTGVSISAGIPGFRKTIHSSGRVTTSIGLPGTGLSYVDTKNIYNKKTSPQITDHTDTYEHNTNENNYQANQYQQVESADIDDIYDTIETPKQKTISCENIKSIHRISDDVIDWTEVLVNPLPIDNFYDVDSWKYLHNHAGAILNGDIDTYLKVINDINPLDDLLDYGNGFEFGTDNPNKIEVEFTIKSDEVMPPKHSLSSIEYYDLLQDYICSCSIRIARDMMALLPVKNVIVHVTDKNETILSVDFDRNVMSKIKFGFTDASNTTLKFRHNMDFNANSGFKPVEQLK